MIPSNARLVGSRRDHRDGRRLQPLRADRRPALGRGLGARLLDLPRDALVLPTDPREQLDAVDDLVEARGRHEERQDVRRLVDVRGADARLEDRDRLLVLRLEPLEPLCLPLEQSSQLVEARLCARELGLQGGHARLGRVDRRLRVLELGDDRRELRRQHAFLRLRLGDLGLERGDASIDRSLLALGSLGGRRRSQHERDREREDSEQAPSHASSFAHPPVDPPPTRRPSACSAAATSRRSGPICAR